jgi:hypothetical protein
MQPLVDFGGEAGIGQITIQRPEADNALTWQAMDAFGACVEQPGATADLRALVVTGAGEPSAPAAIFSSWTATRLAWMGVVFRRPSPMPSISWRPCRSRRSPPSKGRRSAAGPKSPWRATWG